MRATNTNARAGRLSPHRRLQERVVQGSFVGGAQRRFTRVRHHLSRRHHLGVVPDVLLLAPPILLQANHVSRSEPPKLTGPRMRRVLSTIFFRDRPLSQKSLLVLPLLGAHGVVRFIKKEEKLSKKDIPSI
jgi:hypothetical protein